MRDLRDEWGNVTHNMDDIIKIAERFYTTLYASDVGPRKSSEPTRLACGVPPITKEGIEKALNGMKRGRAAGDDGITVDLSKEIGHIIREKLAKLFSEFLRALKYPQPRRTLIQF